MRTVSILLIACGLLAACAGAPTKEPKSTTADALFSQAQTAVKGRDYEDANKLLDRIRDEFPFSRLAVDAELLRADVAYKQEKFLEASAAYRAFEDAHPTHPKAAYAVYWRGRSQLELSRPEDRDQTATHAALEAFQKLLQAYPNSPDAKDAQARVAEARARLAAHEVDVARYYLRKEKIDAAKDRLEAVVQSYPDTPSKEEAQRLLTSIKTRRY